MLVNVKKKTKKKKSFTSFMLMLSSIMPKPNLWGVEYYGRPMYRCIMMRVASHLHRFCL